MNSSSARPVGEAYPFPTPEHWHASPVYHRIRESNTPVAVVNTVRGRDLEAYVITTYTDVRFVLARQDLFSRAQANDVPGYPNLEGFSLGMDGADLARVRKATQRTFTPHGVENLRPRIQADTTELLDAVERSGPPADLVSSFARPLALNTIGELLGVPLADREKFRAWGAGFLSTGTGSETESSEAQAEMGRYIGEELVAQRIEHRTEDLLSEMLDSGMDPSELVKHAMAIMLAGWETTAATIANCVYWLVTHNDDAGVPHYRALQQAGPESLSRARDELLRILPVGRDDGMPRRATQDVRLPSGALIPRGAIVLPSHDSANYDATEFSCPYEADLDRDANPHLSFGYGPHYCIGANLAKVVIQVALANLLRRFPELRLAVPENQLVWSDDISIRGLLELPLTW